MSDHPAITELRESFVLYDERSRHKIQNWIDRWISTNVIETVLSEDDMTGVDQEILFDQMFTRLAKGAIAKKCQSMGGREKNGDFRFMLRLDCLHREPSRTLKAVK